MQNFYSQQSFTTPNIAVHDAKKIGLFVDNKVQLVEEVDDGTFWTEKLKLETKKNLYIIQK